MTNETPTAGVKGAAAKNIQIKEIIIANPIANLVIGTPQENHKRVKQLVYNLFVLMV